MAVLGRSGAGKNKCGFLVLRNLTRRKAFPGLRLETKYRDLISQPEFKDVEVYTIGHEYRPSAV